MGVPALTVSTPAPHRPAKLPTPLWEGQSHSLTHSLTLTELFEAIQVKHAPKSLPGTVRPLEFTDFSPDPDLLALAALAGMVGQTAVATIEARRQRRLDEYRSARTDRSHNVELSAEGETERTASSAGGESARTAEGETATPAQLEEELPGLQALFEDPPAPEVQGQSGRRYHSTSLCWLRPSDQPRCAAILLVEARWFDPFILTIILANCATMAWESPLDPPGTWKAGVLDLTEWFFLYIFTTELVAKVIAYGFVMHEGSYLQDPWCQLDFVVVSCAWLPLLFPSMGNYSVLRALRALRPLRSLRLVPGMAVLISSIISTVPKLANVLALCGFIFLVFGIVGMELFKGTLHYRCALPGFEELPGHPRPERSLAEVVPLGSTLDAALVTALDEAGFAPRPLLGVLHPARARSLEGLADQTVTPASAAAAGALLAVAQLHPLFLPVLRRLRIIEPYKSSGETSEGGGKPVESSGDPDEAAIDAQETFDTGEACNPQLQHHPQCAPGAKCRYFAQAPFAGLMSFDNIGVACIVILQTITFDTWTEAMYALMSAFSPSACIFFVLIVVLGGFFVINLFLAVILQEVLAAHSVEAAPAQHACAHHDALTSPQVLAAHSVEAAKLEMSERQETRSAKDASTAASTAADVEGGLHGLPGAETGVDTDALLSPAGGSSSGAPSAHRGACDCAPPPRSCRLLLAQIVSSGWWGNLSTLAVLLNMALMCMPYESMSDAYEAQLEQGQVVISWIFIGEMGLKLLGLGCMGYWIDGWNQLDGTIVIMSMAEMTITALFADTGTNLSFLRILRMLRVVRILRLMKSWKGLYKIIVTFGKVLPQLSNIFVLMAVTIQIFALVGMQILGGRYNPSTGYSTVPCPGGECQDDALEEKPRYHFDYFFPAITTCFIVMTGTWVDPLSPAVEVGGQVMALFFVTMLVIGCYIIMNLFISILLNAFADDEDEPPVNVGSPGRQRSPPPSPRGSPRPGSSPPSPTRSDGRAEEKRSPVASSAAEFRSPARGPWPQNYSLCLFGPRDRIRMCCQWLVEHERFDQFIVFAIVASSLCLAFDVPRLDPSSELAALLRLLSLVWTAIFACELMLKVIAYGFACTERAYVNDPWNLLDMAIVASSFLVLLAGTFPQLANLKSLRVLRVLRPLRLLARHEGMKLIITSLIKTMPAVSNALGVVLAFQLVFAILGMQMFMGELGSCTDPAIRTPDLCHPPPSPSYFVAYTGLAIARTEASADVAPSLLSYSYEDEYRPLPPQPPSPPLPPSVPSLAATLSIWAGGLGELGGAEAADGRGPSTFGTSALVLQREQVGRRLERGALLDVAAPSDVPKTAPSDVPKAEDGGIISSSRTQLTSKGRGERMLLASGRRRLKGGGGGGINSDVRWSNPPLGSFDSFGSAMLLLYIMSTGDGWDQIMFATMDVSEPGQAPERNDFSASAIFSILWLFVGCFFALNLFVGVVVDQFNRIQKEEGGSATMTEEQQQWVDTMKNAAQTKAIVAVKPPVGCCRLPVYRLVTSNFFDGFITSVIVINVAVMATDCWGIEQNENSYALYTQSLRAFGYVYYTEATLKICALGCAGYFGDAWCRFDFFLVVTSLLDEFASELLANVLPMPPMLLRVLRVLRILRILRLLKGAREVRNLIMTLVFSFPSLINVGSILLLLIYMFAVLGVNMFTWVAYQESITRVRNFESLGNAMLLLMQCLTGDNWSMIMIELMVDETSGRCTEAEGNCGSRLAIPFFLAFQLLAAFVFLNLVVAVILDNFTTLGNVKTGLVSRNDIEFFTDAWAAFDPDATQKIPAERLPELVMQLPPPMGLMGVTGVKRTAGLSKEVIKLCSSMQVRQANGTLTKLRQVEGHVEFSQVLEALVNRNFKVNEVLIEEVADRAKPVAAVRALPFGSPPPGEGESSSAELSETDRGKFEDDVAQLFAIKFVFSKYADKFRRWADRAMAGRTKGYVRAGAGGKAAVAQAQTGKLLPPQKPPPPQPQKQQQMEQRQRPLGVPSVVRSQPQESPVKSQGPVKGPPQESPVKSPRRARCPRNSRDTFAVRSPRNSCETLPATAAAPSAEPEDRATGSRRNSSEAEPAAAPSAERAEPEDRATGSRVTSLEYSLRTQSMGPQGGGGCCLPPMRTRPQSARGAGAPKPERQDGACHVPDQRGEPSAASGGTRNLGALARARMAKTGGRVPALLERTERTVAPRGDRTAAIGRETARGAGGAPAPAPATPAPAPAPAAPAPAPATPAPAPSAIEGCGTASKSRSASFGNRASRGVPAARASAGRTGASAPSPGFGAGLPLPARLPPDRGSFGVSADREGAGGAPSVVALAPRSRPLSPKMAYAEELRTQFQAIRSQMQKSPDSSDAMLSPRPELPRLVTPALHRALRSLPTPYMTPNASNSSLASLGALPAGGPPLPLHFSRPPAVSARSPGLGATLSPRSPSHEALVQEYRALRAEQGFRSIPERD